jgi:ATP-binding protein involved in chromosome partitioning
MVKDVKVDGDRVGFTVVLTTPACPLKGQIQRESEEAIFKKYPEIRKVDINFTSNVTSGIPVDKMALAPGIKNIIAVSSGKGGVGKSTVAVNLAVAFAQTGAKVGILDADIHGPNVPIMMGVRRQPEMIDNKLIPLESYGVKIMSMGFLVDEDSPVIWRGPMFHGIIKQFMEQVAWNDLDYLFIDLPPGTGDAQLSVCQLLPVAGAVIVTTPQDVALGDAKKGLAMFQKVNVPVLGIVENMSYYICGHCGERTEIFSHGGGRRASEKLGVPFLGSIPLVVDVRIGGDEGRPITAVSPESPVSAVFREITGTLAAKISTQNVLSKTKITILGQG